MSVMLMLDHIGRTGFHSSVVLVLIGTGMSCISGCDATAICVGCLMPPVCPWVPRSKGESLQHFVVVQIVQLLCRTVKLGWFDHESHRTIVDDTKRLFLEKGMPGHYLLGLRILNTLVQEMNVATPGRTLTQQRKTAINFRDSCLFKARRLHTHMTCCYLCRSFLLLLCPQHGCDTHMMSPLHPFHYLCQQQPWSHTNPWSSDENL